MTERLYALAILGSLGGCGKDKDDDSQAPVECTTQLNGTLPVAGASEFYVPQRQRELEVFTPRLHCSWNLRRVRFRLRSPDGGQPR